MEKNEIAQRPKFETAAVKAKDMFLQLTDEKTWSREIVFALQILRGNRLLQSADQQSIRDAVVNIATTGATLNPALHQAYLVPRDGKCCLDFSYRGLAKIAVDSGSVIDIDATVVHERDEFYYEMGLEPKLIHRPHLGENPGDMTHVYAIAILHNGVKKFIVLTKAEIEKVRATSKAQNGPWKTWYEEMSRKSAVKKLYKMLPQTDRMSVAVSAINEHEGLEEKTGKASDIASRFDDAIEIVPTNDDCICPACNSQLENGSCHNEHCPEAEPPND